MTMAKVMISIPDALLAETDRIASAEGKTRSGYIQESLNARIDAKHLEAVDAIDRLRESAVPRGGDSLPFIKKMRRER